MFSYHNGISFSKDKWSALIRQWGWSILLIFFALSWLALIGSTWAQAEETEKSDDEYSFNWLDTDKKIYVLQNRRYVKTGHPVLSVLAGTGFSNPYRNTINVDGRFAYYWGEQWGLEAFYTYFSNTENSTIQALKASSPQALPNIREINNQYGLQLHFVPWYAKINVFNSILYFDWYFGAGGGMLESAVDTRTRVSETSNFVQQKDFAFFLSTGHQYHLSSSFLVRMDFTGAFYQAPIYGATGENTWYSNLNFGLGVGWKI